MSDKNKLNVRQEAFCQAYIELGCAKDAYLSAYPAAKDWASQSVHVAASKLISITKISLRISELKAELAAENKITLQSILDELMQSANRSRISGKEREVVNALSAISKILGLDKIAKENQELVQAMLYTPDNKRFTKKQADEASENVSTDL